MELDISKSASVKQSTKKSIFTDFEAAELSVKLEQGESLDEDIKYEVFNEKVRQLPNYTDNAKEYDTYLKTYKQNMFGVGEMSMRTRMMDKFIEDGLYKLDDDDNFINNSGIDSPGADYDLIKGALLFKKYYTTAQDDVKEKVQYYRTEIAKANPNIWESLGGGVMGYADNPETVITDITASFAAAPFIAGPTVAGNILKAFGVEALAVLPAELSLDKKKREFAEYIGEERTLEQSIFDTGVAMTLAGSFRAVGSAGYDLNLLRQIKKRNPGADVDETFRRFMAQKGKRLTSALDIHERALAKGFDDINAGKAVDVEDIADVDFESKIDPEVEQVNMYDEILNTEEAKNDIEFTNNLENEINQTEDFIEPGKADEIEPEYQEMLDEFIEDERFKDDFEELNRLEEQIRAMEQAKQQGAKIPIKLADNVAAGTIAGIEEDEEGNLTFDPAKFVLGFGGYTAAKKAFKSGAFNDLPEQVNKLVSKHFGVELDSKIIVGADAGDEKAFTDLATGRTLREIDDSSVTINKYKQDVDASFNDVITDQVLSGRADIADKIKEFAQDIKGKTNDEAEAIFNEKMGQVGKLTGEEQEKLFDEIDSIGYIIRRAKDKPYGALSDYIDHKELFEKYPELKNYTVQWKMEDLEGGAKGSFSAANDTQGNIIKIDARMPEEEIISTLLHEIQHAVQSIENLPRGGNSGQFKTTPDGELPYDQYRRLYGEQQARAVQYRANMTPEEKASETWQETLARVEGEFKESIIKYREDVAMLNADAPDFISTLKTTIEESQQKTFKKEQLVGFLGKKGIKTDEMKFSGLDDYLQSLPMGAKITKEELLENINFPVLERKVIAAAEPNPDSQYYQLPSVRSAAETTNSRNEFIEALENGYEAYDEVRSAYGDEFLENEYWADDIADDIFGRDELGSTQYKEYSVQNIGKNYREELVTIDNPKQDKTYNSSHWDDLNVLYHIRKQDVEISVENPKYAKAKAEVSTNFDDYYELVEYDNYYKVKKGDTEFAATYSKETLEKNNLDEDGLKKYLMEKTELGKKSPGVKDLRFIPKTKDDKTLLIDEIQSDWHQDARKKGYSRKITDSEKKEMDDLIKQYRTLANERNELINAAIPETLEKQKKINNLMESAEEKLDDVTLTIREDLGIRSIDLARFYRQIRDNGMITDWKAAFDEAVDIPEDIEYIKKKIFSYIDVRLRMNNLTAKEKELEKEIARVTAAIDKDLDFDNTVGAINKRLDELRSLEYGIPEAPYSKTWMEKAMKDQIAEAVRKDYDRVAWVGGDEHNARYPGREESEEKGMKMFYDKMIPDFVKKYIKKYDSKVEVKTLSNGLDVWSFEVTDKMKKAIKEKGQSLYAVPAAVGIAATQQDEEE